MKEKQLKSHTFYCIVLLLLTVCFVVGMCLFDFGCEFTINNLTTVNLVSFILLDVTLLGCIILILAAIITRARKDKLAAGEVELGCEIAAVLIFVTVFCIPIFLIWVCQRIHDSISVRSKELP